MISNPRFGFLSDGEPVLKSETTKPKSYENNHRSDDELNRRRRSINTWNGNSGSVVNTPTRRIVETLVVADQAMVKNHAHDRNSDISTYILTVLNMVSSDFNEKCRRTRSNLKLSIKLSVIFNDYIRDFNSIICDDWFYLFEDL